MSKPPKTTTNVYLYDPLDRLVNAHSTQQFYNSTRIATEIQEQRKICIFEHKDLLLAELHLGNSVTLLATDQQTSVLHGVSHAISQPQSYSPYGYSPTSIGLLNLLGFNGERVDSVTGNYLLGQGYRAFNPVLMRFNSPDKLSPFDKGGINSYVYCGGDPINRNDATGRFWSQILKLRKMFSQVRRLSLDGMSSNRSSPVKLIEIMHGVKVQETPELLRLVKKESKQFGSYQSSLKKYKKHYDLWEKATLSQESIDIIAGHYISLKKYQAKTLKYKNKVIGLRSVIQTYDVPPAYSQYNNYDVLNYNPPDFSSLELESLKIRRNTI